MTTPMDERDRLVERIEAAERHLLRLASLDRSSNLLSVNLTIQQLKTLHVLSHQQPVSGHGLADALGVGPATVSGIVDRLVARGLVRRTEDPNDRRVRLLTLTAEGRRTIDELVDVGREHKRRLLLRLDPDSLRQLADVLDRLGEVAEEEARERDRRQPGSRSLTADRD